MEFGKANLTNSGTGQERAAIYKLGHEQESQRTMIVRIAPPIKDLAAKGTWRVFIKRHFGYVQPVTKKDGTKINIPLPFLCPQEYDREGNVTVQCDECNEIKRFKTEIETAEVALKKEGKDEAAIDSILKHKKAWTKTHNLSRKWYSIGKNLDHKWGYVETSKTCMNDFLETIKSLTADGNDPLGQNGLWFKFTRTGSKFNDISDKAKEMLEKQADGSLRFKSDTLTENDIAQLEKLDSLSALPTVLAKKLTAAQVSEIVKSGGDENVLKAIFNTPTKTESKPQTVTLEESGKTLAQHMVETVAKAEVKKTLSVKEAAEMPVDEFLAQFEN